MNFTELCHQHLRFSIGAADLACLFSTQTSASFSIRVAGYRGWIDVHFPCEGHIKVWIRGALPEECLEASWVSQFIPAFMGQLKIPEDETYEAEFFKPASGIHMAQPVNREGMTDRLQTTRSYRLPERS